MSNRKNHWKRSMLLTKIRQYIGQIALMIVVVESPLPRHQAIPLLAKRSGWYRSWLDRA